MVKKTKISIRKVRAVDNNPKLYIEIPPGIKFTTRKELLIWGYSQPQYGGQFVPTFGDKECTILEDKHRRRSMEDLLAVCRGYFPVTSEKAVAVILFKMNEEINLINGYCHTINKWVFRSLDKPVQMIRDCSSVRQYLDQRGDGAYTMNEIIKLAGK